MNESLYSYFYGDDLYSDFFDEKSGDDNFVSENVTVVALGEEFEDDDAAWIMACIFIIFTMQTGFALVESGMCSLKNEVSIMVMNVMDVGLGGFIFWMVGYGIINGDSEYTTPFMGIGHFFFSPDVTKLGSGEAFLRFFLHSSYIANANTIGSGALAERVNVKAYIIYCFLSALFLCFPANWIWNKVGWLKTLGAVDVAGCGVVHAAGGFSALAGSLLLGPRVGKNFPKHSFTMGNAKNSLTGLFMIWWAFLALNSVSTFGVTEDKWMFSARATVNTIISSFGGGFASLGFCLLFFTHHINVPLILNCVFGSLVAITGSSALITTGQSFVIGLISAFLTFFGMMIVEKIHFDDPCGAFSVHGVNGIWGLLAAGIFADKNNAPSSMLGYNGLLKGEVYLFGIQTLTAVVVAAWSFLSSYLLLLLINKVIKIRVTLVDELLGGDYSSHNILHSGLKIEAAVDILKNFQDIATGLDSTGKNLGHMMFLENHYGKSGKDESDALTRIFNIPVKTDNVLIHEKRNRCRHNRPPRIAESGGFGRLT